jgi:hypothetical protein
VIVGPRHRWIQTGPHPHIMGSPPKGPQPSPGPKPMRRVCPIRDRHIVIVIMRVGDDLCRHFRTPTMVRTVVRRVSGMGNLPDWGRCGVVFHPRCWPKTKITDIGDGKPPSPGTSIGRSHSSPARSRWTGCVEFHHLPPLHQSPHRPPALIAAIARLLLDTGGPKPAPRSVESRLGLSGGFEN